MTHLALARKWRPQRFEDVIGQRGVVDTLKNAIGSGRLAQSFIFAGPRGVGKTTTARILARALNCVNGPTGEPCGSCDACLEIAEGRDIDVLEIDGATYTGVDAVREVIVEPLSIAPMRDRYKIFIIDEVHRLSKSAFDALLKSIEEPPPYVKFMMATTDLHAVPATIQSRSQVFELKALTFGAIREQLKSLMQREGVTIDDGALALVARSAEGSMRDGLSALDQVLAFTSEQVTAGDVSAVLGLIGRDRQFEIADVVAAEDLSGVFALAGRVSEDGFDLRIVCRELARLMRDLLVVKIDASRLSDPEIAAESEQERLKALSARFSREDLMRAFDLLSRSEYDIRQSSQPRHQFEMALVKWIHLRQLTPLTELIASLGGSGTGSPLGTSRPTGPSPQLTPRLAAAPSGAAARPPAVASPVPRPAAAEEKGQAPRPESGAPRPDLKSSLLATIREQNKVFYNMVVASAQKVEVEADAVVFTFAPIHRGLRTQFDRQRAWLEQLVQSAAGRKLAVVSREGEPAPVVQATAADLAEQARQAELRARAKAEPAVQAVLEVFGAEIQNVEEIK
jgi:DNA polymerase-3 subunit gamma/tau